MKILAIETTGPFCSVALIDDNDELEELMGDEKMNHLKTVTPMIEALLARHDLTVADLDVLAVSQGPGSFTGIRIGVSTARALSQATGVPVMTVPTLAAFGDGEGEEGQLVCPVLDARRQQVYAGAYRDFETVVPGGAYMLEEYLALLEEALIEKQATTPYLEENGGALPILFVGDGVDKYSEQIAAWATMRDLAAEGHAIYQSAGNVAEYAMRAIVNFKEQQGSLSSGRAAGEAEDATLCGLLLPYDQVTPEYMRIPEAERKRLAKEAQERGKETARRSST